MSAALFIPTTFAALYVVFCIVTPPPIRWMRLAFNFAALWLSTMAIYVAATALGVIQ